MNFDFNKLVDFPREELERAVEIASTYTWDPDSRSIFSPENLDYKVKLLVPTDTPLRNRIPRTPGLGEAASWLKMTSKLDPGSTGTAIFFADGEEPGETTQSYFAATAPYKLLGRKVQIGLKAVRASSGRPGGLATMLEDRTNVKILEVMLGEEQAIIAGDSSTNADAFDGFYKQVTTNSGTMSLMTVSGLQPHFQTLHEAGGSPDAIVHNARQARALADELTGSGAIQRIILDSAGGITSGARVRSVINEVDGSEVESIVSRYVGGTAMIVQFTTPAGENCLEMEDLLPISQIDKDLAGVSLTRYIVEITALKVIHETFQMKLAGLGT